MWSLQSASLLLFAVIGTGQGAYQDPSPLWTGSMSGPVLDGNGCFISPDNTALICVDSVGTLQGFDPLTGTELFQPFVSGAVTCESGVHFNFNDASAPYMVFGATFGSGNDTTGSIYAFDPTGTPLYEFSCVGSVAGTPVTSYDGQYIYANCNDETGGHFNIYDVSTASTTSANAPTTTLSDSYGPFGPIGYFWNPITGYYLDEGNGNTNDVFVFSTNDPLVKGTPIKEGILYAFQMPVAGGNMTLSKMVEKGFQSSTTPLIANSGLNLYVSGTRGEFRAWAGVEGVNRYRWNNSATGEFEGDRKYNDTRNPEYGSSASAPPSLLDNSSMPNLIIPGAAPEIFMADYNFSEASLMSIETAGFVYSIIAVDPAGDRAYYADITGEIRALNIPDLTTAWSANATASVEGDIALDKGGDVLFYADTSGVVSAWKVTDATLTPAPNAVSDNPSAVPTGMPGGMPGMPSLSPAPVVPDTPAPAPGATPSPANGTNPPPVASPVSGPTQAPVEPPTDSSSAFAHSVLTAMVVALIAVAM